MSECRIAFWAWPGPTNAAMHQLTYVYYQRQDWRGANQSHLLVAYIASSVVNSAVQRD
jgi:hypothetical protein